MVEANYLRRQPSQARGQQRVDAILDAAEAVFAEVGYAAATTNAIAARASTNIASLYQFFPNKEAILAGVVARYRDEYAALAEQVFGGEWPELSLAAQVDRLVEAVLALHTRHGITRPFFVGVGGVSGEFAATEAVVYAELMAHGDRFLQAHAPRLDAAQRRTALEVILRVTQALVHLADTTQGQARAEVVASLKAMLMAHLDGLRR